jgi:hypothetical protein
MLLVELAAERRSVSDLSTATDLPERIVVEALVHLLRMGWIEVRSTPEKALFAATPVGKRRASEEELRPELRREQRWTSLCMDRLTGSWLRSDDLDLVYERDLPDAAAVVEPRLGTLNYEDPGVRDLIYLKANEGFEGFQPAARAPSRPYARVVISYNEIERGLPPYTSLRLRSEVVSAAKDISELSDASDTEESSTTSDIELPLDTLTSDDIIVGGPEHRELIGAALEKAKSHIIIHSCFLNPDAVEKLLPDFEKAAKRKVRIDLLWGLRSDPESTEKPKAISEVDRALDGLPPAFRARVQLSPLSSGSHCKVIMYDDTATDRWVSVVGSCNFLSANFDAIEVSLRSRSRRIASQLLGYLISAQIPASGGWSAVTRRLNKSWDVIRRRPAGSSETGVHQLILLADEDHYACVTLARDAAKHGIDVACDLFGLAAETSVLVPLERAAQLGRRAHLYYQRSSKFLKEQGRTADQSSIERRGLGLTQVEHLHGKFLVWDEEALAVTSFNWLSTVVEGTRNRGAELGLLALGPDLRKMLEQKLAKVAPKIPLTPIASSAKAGGESSGSLGRET